MRLRKRNTIKIDEKQELRAILIINLNGM
jgi:hypothetical protein